MEKKAIISKDKIYRYKLSRTWDSTKPTILFIGLNPSIADENIDDQTITRCINFAKDWGYGTLLMANLFAFRSTYPKDIYLIDDPIGKDNDNDHYLLECVTQSDLIVACWGNNGTYMNREKVITELVPNLYCLQKNKNGTPHHPLRPPRNIHPVPFNF
ncbi:DUF1643 domain-containing protein [Streptococcus constellatus]|uniref:DUF1643 domain-containing protein n=1 Tax=Streptococcus constellatus TaxID=76860 RepID=UPI00123BB191|nr:DUF1643 domain-containing protein [Streptococcus constellatus]QQC22453.1 DUF1643 domain-containing protein [Streptococcus constellatus]